MSKATFDPYSVLLEITSDPNLFYAKSSNSYDYYAVVLTGEGSAVCSCAAGENGLNCRHRKATLARFPYMTVDTEPTDAQWESLLLKISVIEDREAAEELFSTAA